MEPLEIEVKFYLNNIQPVRNRLFELGAKNEGRIFETNIRFENKENSLIQKNSLLRLRKDNKATLTFKSEAADKDQQYKIHKELEVKVSDFKTMVSILEALGFYQAQMYEKWRELFKIKDTSFCIDTLPFGNFLEIEGPKEEIKKWAGVMGFQWGKRILLNYLALFSVIKTALNLPFSDITFQNFEGISIDLQNYLHLFETDRK